VSALRDLIGALEDHAASLGQFDQINRHEPKSAPGRGLTAAIWVDRLRPVRTSGLNSVSVALDVMVRVYLPMLTEPQDEIDPLMLDAVDALCATYGGDFQLGGRVRSVDLFGAGGVQLQAQAGYMQQDGRLYRVMTITVPCVVNDLWTEAP
jgi:hypothetical protein